MQPTRLDPATLERLRELVEVNFGFRDELYAAAASLDDDDRRRVCRQLAEYLAGNAVDLQQVLAVAGHDLAGPLDVDGIVTALFEAIKARSGTPGVLDVAAEAERDLKSGYDRTIEESSNSEAEGLLRRQRQALERNEDVLETMKRRAERPPEEEADGPKP